MGWKVFLCWLRACPPEPATPAPRQLELRLPCWRHRRVRPATPESRQSSGRLLPGRFQSGSCIPFACLYQPGRTVAKRLQSRAVGPSTIWQSELLLEEVLEGLAGVVRARRGGRRRRPAPFPGRGGPGVFLPPWAAVLKTALVSLRPLATS